MLNIKINETTPINNPDYEIKRCKMIKYCFYYIYIMIASILPVVAIVDLVRPQYNRPLPVLIITIILIIMMIILLIGMSFYMGYKCFKLKN